MRGPYGLDIIDDCRRCPIKQDHLFCNLPMNILQHLTQIKATAIYPKAAVLFSQGQQPRGIFVLCVGRAKLSASTCAGKTLITKIAVHGDVLGLGAVISNRQYEVTAEMMEPGQADFIPRNEFLEFMNKHQEVALRLTKQLSRDYFEAYDAVCTLGLAISPAEKLAKLLLSWHGSNGQLMFSHEEIAEMIGSTRETVTRLFSAFKKKDLLHVKGAKLIILNKGKLQDIQSNLASLK